MDKEFERHDLGSARLHHLRAAAHLGTPLLGAHDEVMLITSEEQKRKCAELSKAEPLRGGKHTGRRIGAVLAPERFRAEGQQDVSDDDSPHIKTILIQVMQRVALVPALIRDRVSVKKL